MLRNTMKETTPSCLLTDVSHFLLAKVAVFHVPLVESASEV